MGKWRVICLALAAFQGWAGADEGLWSLGFRTQGFVDFEPGNDYILGPEIGYSNFYLAAHRLQFKAAYLTTRLEQAFRENIPKQDYFLFSPVWHFRRKGIFDPTFQADLGYTRYDPGPIEGLDNDSWIAALQLGLSLNLYQGEYGLFYHLGYNFITPDSSLVYPGIFGVGFWAML